MRESRLPQLFQIPTHYYSTFGLVHREERAHINVLKITPKSRILVWLFRTKPSVEKVLLRVPYERVHLLHDLISDQTEAYFDKKKRRLYARATRDLEQFVQETRYQPVAVNIGS